MRSKYALLENKYNGWYPTFRGKFLLLGNKTLSKEAYLLYEASVAFADWDKEHKTYGLLLLSQSEIENLLCFSKGYVSRYGKMLINKGFWEKLPDMGIRVLGFELIEIKLLKEVVKKDKVVDLQKYLAETQQSFTNKRGLDTKEDTNVPLQNVANLQNNNSKYLVSFKDKCFIPRSYEEYQRIYQEGNFERLNPEDMRLVDEIIFETMGINPT